MGNPSDSKLKISLTEARRHVAAVEKALADGYPPPGHPTTNKVRAALRVASEAIGLPNEDTMRRRVGTPTGRGSIERRYGLTVDWSKYKPPPAPEVPPPPQPEPPADPVDTERERKKSRDLAAENKALLERVIKAEDLRAGVLGLLDPPLVPKITFPAPSARKGQRTVVLHFSDWHVGETVDIDEMGGVNAYSIAVFQKRAGRLCASAVALLTEHWKGTPPEKIVLIFGGDMITGEIHDELAKTNEALSAPAVRICAETLAGIVIELRKIAPLDIYTVPGNHGRLTKKPESKGMAVNSFDTLISSVVEMTIKTAGVKGVTFYYPKSGDALFNVYRWTFCAVHGDRIGSRGGQGFQGPLATVLRGIHKTRAYYAGQSVIVDYFFVGHFHTSAKIPRAFCNGSLVGPSEYSRDLRADPEPSKQNMIVVHSERGFIDYQELYCGDPSEGSIYRAQPT